MTKPTPTKGYEEAPADEHADDEHAGHDGHAVAKGVGVVHGRLPDGYTGPFVLLEVVTDRGQTYWVGLDTEDCAAIAAMADDVAKRKRVH